MDYQVRFLEILKAKAWNKEVETLLKEWFSRVSSRYVPNKNLLFSMSNPNYFDELFYSLENVSSVRILSAEEFLNSKEAYAEKLKKSLKTTKNCEGIRFQKVGEQLIQDSTGPYLFTVKGCMNFETKVITLFLDFPNMIETFHHELRHIFESLTRFDYPDDLPFSKIGDLMVKEGDAIYHTFLMFQEYMIFHPYSCSIDESVDKNLLYYLGYYLIMATIPLEERQIWFQKGFYEMCVHFNENYNEKDVSDLVYHLAYVLVALMKNEKMSNEDILQNACYSKSGCMLQDLLISKIKEIVHYDFNLQTMIGEIENLVNQKIVDLFHEQEQEYLEQCKLELELS